MVLAVLLVINFKIMKQINAWWVVIMSLCSIQQMTAQCPNCIINLPPGIPADTIVIDSVPDAYKNGYYEEALTYRIPYTTDPLAAVAPPGTNVPTGLTIDSFIVLSVTNMPPGLQWTGDRPVPMVYNELAPQTRDGCITLCGTPAVSGTFTINVNLQVMIQGFVFPSPPIPVEFTVLPDTNAPFVYSPPSGCAPLSVYIDNRVTSGGSPGFSYFWDFGNGDSSTVEQPDTIVYDFGLMTDTTVAIYQRVIIDTFPYLLETIVVTDDTGNSCNDDVGVAPLVIRGAPDMYIILTGNGDTLNTDPNFGLIGNTENSEYAPDTMEFPGPIVLADGQSYSLEIWDDDNSNFINPADDPCGSGPVTFSTALGVGTHSLQTGSMTIEITLSQIIDTVEYVDSVTVEYCNIAVNQIEAVNRSLQVFPNPTADLLNVQFQVPLAADEVEIMVSDLLGRTIYTEQLGDFQGTYQNALSLGGQPDGMYVLRLRVDNQVTAKKIILQR